MNAIITSLGGRAPPGRNTRTPSSEFRWRVAARSSHVQAVSDAGVHRSSGLAAGRCHAQPDGPTAEGLPRCIRVSRRPIESHSTAIRGPPYAPALGGPHAHAVLGSTLRVVPWATSSL